jgi:radical SAM superfamily enzyme with C-terminal helix-hairpin-helix motif
MMKVAIIDGYVDEPSCLGVPPYISPYPRYIYGMLKFAGINPFYVTIDTLRQNYRLKKSLYDFDLLIVIAGMAVPGKYLGGTPLGLKELFALFPVNRAEKILVGPIVLELTEKETKKLEDYLVLDFPFEEELLAYLQRYSHREMPEGRGRDVINRFAVLGAEVIRHHPDFPNIICEIETYRGCYWRQCSFCIERIHGNPSMRSPEGVLAEIEALYRNGCRFFRLGNQTDFFTYMGDFSKEPPEPNPEKMKEFHREIWRRCPGIKTLHLDNVNPKTIAEYPEESKDIIKTVVIYQTPGNIAAMGLESADERVIEKNNLAASPEEVMEAVEMINRYGRFASYNGLPYFLPGLNFVAGLKGEKRETYELNYEFLERIVEENLLLRRINIRQVKVFRATPMETIGDRLLKKHRKYFRLFKEKVRRNIDRLILQKMIPVGRKMTELRCEQKENNITFARQIGTYPLLVGVIGTHERNSFIDVRITGYGRRSITAVKYPLSIENLTKDEAKAIPGFGRQLVEKAVLEKNFEAVLKMAESSKELRKLLKVYFDIDV